MKSFSTNFSTLRMLSNEPIEVKINETKFNLNYPTLKTLENNSVNFLIGFLQKDFKELNDLIAGYEFENHYKLILFLSIIGPRTGGDIGDITKLILEGLRYFIPELTISNGFMKIQEEHIQKEHFENIIEIIFKMFDKEYELIKEEDDEFTRREKERKRQIERIRSNSRKNKGEEQGLESMLAGILYEFPQYKLEDLFNLNLYCIYYLFRYVGKIANYEISKIAYGNGLMKKGTHKHFIEN